MEMAWATINGHIYPRRHRVEIVSWRKNRLPSMKDVLQSEAAMTMMGAMLVNCINKLSMRSLFNSHFETVPLEIQQHGL